MSDAYNMSIRKFLKQVGVTSQSAIEDALRSAGADGESYSARMVLTIDGLDVEHVIEGTIGSRGE
ncbi:DUF6494 family protein [Seohaeicola saemankumensis]|nr:DUF6494 family protein [Seohaeicola saemankumensis]MCA0869846.1 DUF6494 family protein [Seohaeicola saemankumensis]